MQPDSPSDQGGRKPAETSDAPALCGKCGREPPTPGPFTKRQGPSDGFWFVETATIDRLALFRREADADRFMESNHSEIPNSSPPPDLDAERNRVIATLAIDYVRKFNVYMSTSYDEEVSKVAAANNAVDESHEALLAAWNQMNAPSVEGTKR